MAGESTQLRALDPDAPACVHHWLLGEPVGNQLMRGAAGAVPPSG